MFMADAIGFDDGAGLGAGRAVWTGPHGDRLFSVLRGYSVETRRRIRATITGGTGQYAGITGEYALTWQYVVTAEGDVVQGRSVDLAGRFRVEKQP